MKLSHIILPILLTACGATQSGKVHDVPLSKPQVRTTSETPVHKQAVPVTTAKLVDMTATSDGEYKLVLRDFKRHVAVQRESNWCWAACLEMVNGFRRIAGASTQEEVVAHFQAPGCNEPARRVVIMRGLHPDLEVEVARDLYTLTAGLLDQRSDRLIVDLAKGQPAIVGLDFEGTLHACVVIGVSYNLTETQSPRMELQLTKEHSELGDTVGDLIGGEAQRWIRGGREVLNRAHVYAPNALALRTVTIVDPWDGSVSTLDAEDFARRCSLILTPSAARAVLEDERLKVTARQGLGELAQLLR